MRTRRDSEEVLAESRQAIDVLTRLVARLEVYVERVESELGNGQDGGDSDKRTAGE